MKNQREICLAEFKKSGIADTPMNWHIWKRAFDRGASNAIKDNNEAKHSFYDLNKGDYVVNLYSESKHVTKGKKYLVIDCVHLKNNYASLMTIDNYSITIAQIVDDFGKKRRMVRSDSKLWKKL